MAGNGEDEKYILRAHVVGPDKKPIAYAVVEPDGVGSDGGTTWGGPQGFPDQKLTDTNGEFVFGRGTPLTDYKWR